MRLLLALVVLTLPATGQDLFEAARIYPREDLGTIRLVAHMDGDTHADLVWIGEDSVQVWFNDGAGEFQPGPLHVLLGPPALQSIGLSPAVGDVNGDGEQDLLFARTDLEPNGIAVLFGLGGGAFAPEHVIDLPVASGGAPSGNAQALCVGNFDADPALEIATAHNTSPSFSVDDIRADLTLWDWNGVTFVSSTPVVLDGALGRVDSMDPPTSTGTGSTTSPSPRIASSSSPLRSRSQPSGAAACRCSGLRSR